MEQLSKERQVIRLETTESTNNYLKQLLQEQALPEGSLVVADYQSQGRGQMGNGWSAERGKNLLFSLLLYPGSVPANEQFIISRMASLAVKNTLDQFTDDIRIKWPNDIYWKEKKIAGMLIENDVMGKHIQHSIIGIGININQDRFPEELPNPVSLKQITGTVQDREYILDTFTREFFLLYREFQGGDTKAIEDEYMMDLYRVNEYHWYEDSKGKFQGVIHDVLPSGHLIVKTLGDGEVRKYAFKEIAFIDQPT